MSGTKLLKLLRLTVFPARFAFLGGSATDDAGGTWP
jgi:hypothetical protein